MSHYAKIVSNYNSIIYPPLVNKFLKIATPINCLVCCFIEYIRTHSHYKEELIITTWNIGFRSTVYIIAFAFISRFPHGSIVINILLFLFNLYQIKIFRKKTKC